MCNPWFAKRFNGVNDDIFDDIRYMDIPLDDLEGIDCRLSGEDVIRDFDDLPINDIQETGCGQLFGDSLVESFDFSCDESSQLTHQSSTTKPSSRGNISSCSGAIRTPIPKRCRSKRRRALKKKNPTLLPGNSIKIKKFPSKQSVFVRRCTHCEVTKTPQWREGPKGPNTLCNACGVRYRSGRLFLEYRPAASPTFVSSLHSNSHMRVVEMRKTRGKLLTIAGPFMYIGETRRNLDDDMFG